MKTEQRRMIPETLDNTEDYVNLREHMMEDLVHHELYRPTYLLRDALEPHLIAEMVILDDVELQLRYEVMQQEIQNEN